MMKTIRSALDAALSAYFLTFMFAFGVTGKVHAQTYVRPSKGTAINVIENKTVGIGSNCTFTTPCKSALYDFTSFDSAQVTIVAASDGSLLAGPFSVSNLPPYVQFQLRGPSGFGASSTFGVLGATSKTATPILLSDTANGTHYAAIPNATAVTLVVVPQPFSQNLSVVGTTKAGDAVLQNMPIGVGGTTKLRAYPGAPFPIDGAEVMGGVGVNGYVNEPTVGALNVQVTGVGIGGVLHSNLPVGGYGYDGPPETQNALKVNTSGQISVSSVGSITNTVSTQSVRTHTYDTSLTSPATAPQLPCVGLCPLPNPAFIYTAPLILPGGVAGSVRFQVTTNAAPVYCRFGSRPDATHYAFKLAAESAAGKGDGGTITLSDLASGTTIYCGGVGAASELSVMQF